MTDIVDRVTRSRIMSGTRGKNTQPKLRLRRLLHAEGFRFRLHDRRLPGKPDIVLPKWKVAIQVHGCFWHRHEGCRYLTMSMLPDLPSSVCAKSVVRKAIAHQVLENLSCGWEEKLCN
jgi:DNA mismatch endonuclease (patch repair protein)